MAVLVHVKTLVDSRKLCEVRYSPTRAVSELQPMECVGPRATLFAREMVKPRNGDSLQDVSEGRDHKCGAVTGLLASTSRTEANLGVRKRSQ